MGESSRCVKRTGQQGWPLANPLQDAYFFTFCWRSDFGEINFAESEKAAEISAPSLAAFLQKLHTQLLTQNDAFKLILITHRLGAKITLEAFNRMALNEASGWLTRIIMIEPALTVESVTTQTFSWTLLSHFGEGWQAPE